MRGTFEVNNYQQERLTEDRVDVYYRKKTEEIVSILSYLNHEQTTSIGNSNHGQKIIPIVDIYYFGIVDKKVFIYLKEEYIVQT